MSNLKYVTPESTKALWEFLCKKYKVKIVRKDKSWVMRKAGWAMEKLGYMSKKKFLNNYVTTLKKTIYMPKDDIDNLGTGNNYELIIQICLAAHEFTHIIQKLGLSYLSNRGKRIRSELKAFSGQGEIYHWLTGGFYNPKTIAQKLIPYGAKESDMSYIKTRQRLSNNLIRDNIYKSKITADIIEFLTNFTHHR